jgi:transcriptional regulator with PAS, ATPase and Fis domain
MNMHILSDQQFQQITTALEQAFVAINAAQHVEIDLTKPKQTIPLPAGEEIVRTKPVRQSQSKTRKSSRKARAALTEKKVVQIKRELATGGKSVAKIAKEFGVHPTTINCIKWGKTWKHVALQQDAPLAVVI